MSVSSCRSLCRRSVLLSVERTITHSMSLACAYRKSHADPAGGSHDVPVRGARNLRSPLSGSEPERVEEPVGTDDVVVEA